MREELKKEILEKQKQLKTKLKQRNWALELKQNSSEFQKSIWNRLCEEYYDDNSYSMLKYKRKPKMLSVSYRVYKAQTVLNSSGDTYSMYLQKYIGAYDNNTCELYAIEPPLNNQVRTIIVSDCLDKEVLFGEYQELFSLSWAYSLPQSIDRHPNELTIMIQKEDFKKILDDLEKNTVDTQKNRGKKNRSKNLTNYNQN